MKPLSASSRVGKTFPPATRTGSVVDLDRRGAGGFRGTVLASHGAFLVMWEKEWSSVHSRLVNRIGRGCTVGPSRRGGWR